MNKNIVAVLSLILAGLLYPFMLQDLIAETQSLRTEIAGLEETLQKAKDFIAIRNELIERSEEFTQTELTKLEQMLPSEVNAIQLALDLEKLGERAGLILKGNVGIDVSGAEANTSRTQRRNIQEDESSPIEPIALNLSFIGRYPNLENFLQSISESLTLLDVQSISFSSGETDIYDYGITLQTYQLNTSSTE